ncbi:MAG: ribonuclease D [Pseudomonadota bacterium]
MQDFVFVANDSQLEECVEQHRAADVLFLDTEFVREKTYFPELCLVQIRSRFGSSCVDAISCESVGKLADLLECQERTCVFHSCRQDLEALDTQFPVDKMALFDTQLASSFCRVEDQISYANMVERICGVTLSKAHTRTDWRRRPLSKGQLEYAMDDVNYLQDIYLDVSDELNRQNRLPWLVDECEQIVDEREYRVDQTTIDGSWRKLKGGARLPLDAQEIAKGLAVWRESRAIDRNRPREWILPTAAIHEISVRKPSGRRALAGLEKVPDAVIRRYGEDILALVESCRDLPVDQPVWRELATLAPEQRSRVKRLMQTLKDICEQETISPALVANRTDIEKLVRGDHAGLRLLRSWRLELAGERLLAVT